MSPALPETSIPVFQDIATYRTWRHAARKQDKSVGFVPTMGALHKGHLSLVKQSLAENDLTVVSIFVNPAQFAPHEDLATYPRTLPTDLAQLEALASGDKKVSAVFVPAVSEMYPAGISQNVTEQIGTFVEVKGYGEQMEGKSRPTFFRGVATVVTKLFNAIEPDHAYFGQKDIQQAILLRRLTKDVLLSHPSAENVHIVPTERDPTDGLALSSRNTYLTQDARRVAPILYQALSLARDEWNNGRTKEESLNAAITKVCDMSQSLQSEQSAVTIKLDYIQFNLSSTLQEIDSHAGHQTFDEPILLSGAVWVNKTRLIDNLILGDAKKILF